MPSLSTTSTTQIASTIPPSAMPFISPSALLQAHLTQNPPLRPSSRLPAECRQIALNTSSLSHANGSALVRTGATSIVCGVRAELLPIDSIANYRVRRSDDVPPEEGGGGEEEEEEYMEVVAGNNLLVPNIELSTGCSPKHLPGAPPSIEAQSLSQRLLSLLHSSKVVRREDLEIRYTLPPDSDPEELAKGPQVKAYWCLYIDTVCISYDGNIFDAAWLAMYAALRNTLLPRSWWDADMKTVLCSPVMGEARKLELQGMPVPLSWVVFVPEFRTGRKPGQEDMWVLCDPDAFEEECCLEGGCMVADMDSRGQVEMLKLEKSGGGKMGSQELRNLLESAEKRWRAWEKTLEAG